MYSCLTFSSQHWLWESSMLLPVAVVCSLSLLYYIPWHAYITIYLSILFIIGKWVVSSSGLLQTTLLWTFLEMLFWCTYVPISVELFGHRICTCSTSASTVKQFFKWLCQLRFLRTVYENSSCPINICYVFPILAILVGV